MTTSTRPQQQHALLVHSKGKSVLITTHPVPSPEPDQLLIKTIAVALNPSEWMELDWYPIPGMILGSDYSGIVIEVGSEVTGWKVGDRVAGFVSPLIMGNNSLEGAFAQYVIGAADLAMHIPEHVSFEAAATVGMGVSTASQVLFQSLELPLPFSAEAEEKEQKETVLIYGAGTATGGFAVQLAKAAGARVLVTASPKHHEYLRSLGADEVFDYRDPSSPEKIRLLTSSSLTRVLDCIGTPQTAEFCLSCFASPSTSPNSPQLIYAPLIKAPTPSRPDIKNILRLVHTWVGKELRLGDLYFPPMPEDRRVAKEVWKAVERLFMEGKMRAVRFEKKNGGLKAIAEGIERLRRGEVGTGKEVYVVAETAGLE